MHGNLDFIKTRLHLRVTFFQWPWPGSGLVILAGHFYFPGIHGMSKSKYFCFTLNNYRPGDVELLTFRLSQNCSYFVVGRETGESGTRHLQGYFELLNRARLSTIKTRLGFAGLHLECRRGSASQASEYCKKDGDYYEFGTISRSEQGRRTDIEALHRSLQEKKGLREISDEHFGSFLKYRRSIYAYRSIHAGQRDWVCSVVVYWGRTGTGKTRNVFDNNESVWVYPGGGWFDGYDGDQIVLFDDFSGSEFKIGYLLKLLDRYPMQVPIKGDFVSWVPTEIYITSNLDPRVWYPNAHGEHVEALFRRFTNVVHFE